MTQLPFNLPEYACIEQLIERCAISYASPQERNEALSAWLAGVLASYRPDPTMLIKETCCGKHWQPQGTRMIHQMEYEAYDASVRYKPTRHADDGLGAFRYCKDCPNHPQREHPTSCPYGGFDELNERLAHQHRSLSAPMVACIRMAWDEPELFMQHCEAAQHDPAALLERIYPTGTHMLEHLWNALHHYWEGKWVDEKKNPAKS